MGSDLGIGNASSPTAQTGLLDAALVTRLAAPVVAAPDAARAAVTSPLNGAVLAELPVSTVPDVEAAVERAREAQAVWAERNVHDRAAVLLRLHDLVPRQVRLELAVGNGSDGNVMEKLLPTPQHEHGD